MVKLMRSMLMTVVLVGAITVATPVVAQGAIGTWAAGSWDDKPTVWRGVRAYNYVMDNPTIYARHVNSIYLTQPTSPYTGQPYGYEVGWLWNAAQPPQWFAVRVNVFGEYGQVMGPIAAHPNNNRLTVVLYGGNAKMAVDSTNIWVDSPSIISAGNGYAGSERHDTAETNYAHFWSLLRMDSSGVWSNWSNQKVWKDNDDDYWVNRNGHTEVWVQHL